MPLTSVFPHYFHHFKHVLIDRVFFNRKNVKSQGFAKSQEVCTWEAKQPLVYQWCSSEVCKNILKRFINTMLMICWWTGLLRWLFWPLQLWCPHYQRARFSRWAFFDKCLPLGVGVQNVFELKHLSNRQVGVYSRLSYNCPSPPKKQY